MTLLHAPFREATYEQWVTASHHITTASLFGGEYHKRGNRPALIWMMINADPAWTSDPAPFLDQ